MNHFKAGWIVKSLFDKLIYILNEKVRSLISSCQRKSSSNLLLTSDFYFFFLQHNSAYFLIHC